MALKTFVRFLTLLAMALAAAFFLWPMDPEEETHIISIGETAINVEIASNDAARAQGLSGRESLKEGSGMLFVFEEEGNHGIWMKDMQFPIDIIWADREGVIISIAENISPDTYPQVFFPAAPAAKYVLEVPAGFAGKRDIREGMKISINANTPL